MKICLISPPDRSKIKEDIEYCVTVYNMPHLGVGYIASYLRSQGIALDYYECPGMRISFEKLKSILEENRYDIVGISSYDYNSFNILKLAKIIKRASPNAFVFLGGYYATLNCGELMQQIPEISCCVLGEGELTVCELMKCLLEGISYEHVSGIVYRKNGDVIQNPSRPLIADLDMLPFPERKFIAKRGIATLITSRGCYGRCIFCSIRAFYKNLDGPVIRFRSARNVVDEIEMLVKEYKVNFINIFDDNFLVQSQENIERIYEMCRLIKEKGLIFRFCITVRANDVIKSKALLTVLKEAGLQYIFIGIESFLERQLELYHKNTKPQDNIDALNVAKELGIKTDIGFLAFDPYATLDEIISNVKILCNTSHFSNFYEGCMHVTSFTAISPVYGSELRERLENEGMISQDNPYCFVNKDVKTSYELMKIWAEKVYDINLRYYLILKMRDDGEDALAAELYECKRNFMIIDAQFLLQLCEDVKNKVVRLETYEEYMQPWLTKLEPIYKRFLQAKEGMR